MESTSEIETRPARPSDLAPIVTIYNQAVAIGATADLDPVDVADREAWFRRHVPESYPILVATVDGTVVGWVSLSRYRSGRMAVRRTAEISYYVHERHRRQRIGSTLVRAAIERCPDLGLRTLFAILLDDNEASVALLEGLGFRRWGHLPRVAEFDGRDVGHFYYGLHVGAVEERHP